MARLRAACGGLFVVLVLVTPATPVGATVPIAILSVNQGSATCSDSLPRSLVGRGGAWCSLAPAGRLAQPGDVVLVAPGTYAAPFQPTVSGTASAPITFHAGAGVYVTATVKLSGVANLVLDGFTVTGSPAQGLWLDGASSIALEHLTVTGNAGHGVVLKGTRAVTLADSTLSGNLGAGLFETGTSSDDAIVRNTISGNGRDGSPYNGDGIQLAGVNTLVVQNTITGNGDPGPYEHGIYVGASAVGYVLEGNTIWGNAASDIKADGSGTVRYNFLGTGMFGLVLSDDSAPVQVYENVIAGAFQHAVLATTNKTPAQAQLWNNTIVQTGRSTTSGNASALFVLSASSLDLRNNLICYTNPDDLGIAVWINAASSLSGLTSDRNWLCDVDRYGRAFAWNGSRVATAQWQATTGQDAATIVTTPPAFDEVFRVASANLGAGRGAPLGLPRDFVGTLVPLVAPDIGAYQTP